VVLTKGSDKTRVYRRKTYTEGIDSRKIIIRLAATTIKYRLTTAMVRILPACGTFRLAYTATNAMRQNAYKFYPDVQERI